MTDAWKDDSAFKNLSNNRDLLFHKLSWHCASLECEACDGRVHYHVKRFKNKEFNATTGEVKEIFEEFEWNTEFQSVQLEGGVTQSRENTPEGSRCECFCHQPRKSKGGVSNITGTLSSIPSIPSKLKSAGKKLHDMLTDEEKQKLR